LYFFIVKFWLDDYEEQVNALSTTFYAWHDTTGAPAYYKGFWWLNIYQRYWGNSCCL